MRIATWNVNSVKQRSENLLAWLCERQPDVVCLQETKCVDEAFPREAIEAAGYNVAVHGQKAFNGVAILSKAPGVKVVDDRAKNYFPMPIDASGQGDVLVGRIRKDLSDPSGHSISIFVAADQLLKGAALNAVQIAELLPERVMA